VINGLSSIGGGAGAVTGLWSGDANGHLPQQLQQQQQNPYSSVLGIPPGPSRNSLDGFPGLPSTSGVNSSEQQRQQSLGASTSGRQGGIAETCGRLWQPDENKPVDSLLGLGGYALGQRPVQQQQQQGGTLLHQESLSSKDPVLESFGSETGGGGGSLLRAATGNLQQSRLMNCYGWQPLFTDSNAQQQPSVLQQLQQQHQQRLSVPSSPFLVGVQGTVNTTASLDLSGQENKTSSQEDETDLEGLMATLMCH
jgi:hypothetical protein